MLRLKDGENLVAYFSMEIGIDPQIPTYAGGLGVLAGDTLRSMADLGIPAVGVTLLSEDGYFNQTINEEKGQIESFERWPFDRYLDRLPQEITIQTGKYNIFVRIWRYTVTGIHGGKVPILFLDTDYDKNDAQLRKITQRLYPVNKVLRLLQEVVLGVGGYKALEAVGYKPTVYHLNEGHSAFLTLEFLDRVRSNTAIEDPYEYVRSKCVFTTHTPVPAGHDTFDPGILEDNLEGYDLLKTIPNAFDDDGKLNMTKLALSMSNKVNGVAKEHAAVSRKMFPHHTISAITNGVHHTFWTSPPFQEIFNEYIPGWYDDPFALRSALNIPDYRIRQAHCQNKKILNKYIKDHTLVEFDEKTITIGFARRITKYKRPDLIFYDLEKLNYIAKRFPIQIVFAGKAHPEDKVGKSIIKEILNLNGKLSSRIKFVFLEGYDINLAKKIIPGVDVWLNTPKRPLEASGTSGMKAAINGVPHLSVLDGWWIEGYIEGTTGWSIGPKPSPDGYEKEDVDADDSDDLYFKLREVILPMYYHNKAQFTKIQKQAIALNGSYFNSHRMVQQYILKSYLG